MPESNRYRPNANKRRYRPGSGTLSLPSLFPGAQILEHTHEQLCQQEQQACRARDMLDNLEKRSRYFDLKTQQGTTQPHQGHERSEQKMSRKDLENASEINGHIGLNERGSFNYDKYGRKARTHQYSLIGSALTKGMEFPRHDPDYIAYPEEAYVPTTASGPRQYWPQSNQSAENAKRNRSAPATEDLPPNIRHQFGTSVCQAVLADSGKVAETLDGQRRLANSLRRTRVVKTVRSLKPEDTNPQYEALGLALRQNVFPGYTYDHKNSITKTIYNPDVHNNRVPDPDEFRYQRDELSK